MLVEEKRSEFVTKFEESAAELIYTEENFSKETLSLFLRDMNSIDFSEQVLSQISEKKNGFE